MYEDFTKIKIRHTQKMCKEFSWFCFFQNSREPQCEYLTIKPWHWRSVAFIMKKYNNTVPIHLLKQKGLPVVTRGSPFPNHLKLRLWKRKTERNFSGSFTTPTWLSCWCSLTFINSYSMNSSSYCFGRRTECWEIGLRIGGSEKVKGMAKSNLQSAFALFSSNLLLRTFTTAIAKIQTCLYIQSIIFIDICKSTQGTYSSI